MDEPAEEVRAADTVPSVRVCSWLRRSQVEAAMRSTPVVVHHVLAKDSLEMAL